MSIDERELRSRLTETAALAGPPRFATDGLAAQVRRIRRRRRRGRVEVIAAVSAALASAVVIPLTHGGTLHGVMSLAPPIPPQLSYSVTVNGQTRAVPATGGPQLFTVTRGERLTMTVEVTVPRQWEIRALWLGITNGVLSGHATMNPVLAASTGVRLRPGAHRFALRWTVPAGLAPGTTRQLSADWTYRNPEPGEAEGEVADFAVPLPTGATSPVAVAHRLRAMALHAVTSCDGDRPAWIRAVRTTSGKAMAMVGGGNDMDEATAAVYLVLMKGDFALGGGGPGSPMCGRSWSTGPYFFGVFDSATLVPLQLALGNRPPPVPLQTLGPVLNLR
ncbi:MAG TPA: hypothetical protein VGS19_06710 [Streptosporangiaceae bacterium]|nr:hypothetical protein [Streptosporangiaceae bacterium]